MCEQKAYMDADWTGSITNKRSTIGYWTFLVSWNSKKQTITAKSSVEAECGAVGHGCCE